MNAVIDAVRKKYPAYANVDDDSLTRAIGDKYPQYLKDEAFAADYSRLIDTSGFTTPADKPEFARNVSTDLPPEESVTPEVTQKLDPSQIDPRPPGGGPSLGESQRMGGGMNDPGDPREGAFANALFNEAPAAALTYVGNVARGAVADAAVGIRTLGENTTEARKTSVESSGNLPAAIMGKPLPIDQTLGEAAKEAADRGEFPTAAVTGQLSQGLAAMAPLAAIGLAPAMVQRLAALGFSADMIYHAPELFKEYAEEINKPKEEQDPDKIAKLTSGIMQTFVFAPLAGKHGTSVIPKPGVRTPAEVAARTVFDEAAKAELPNELITISQQKSPEVIQLERANAPMTAKVVEQIQKSEPPKSEKIDTGAEGGQGGEVTPLESSPKPKEPPQPTNISTQTDKPENLGAPAAAKSIVGEQTAGENLKPGESVTSSKYGQGKVVADMGERVRVDFGDGNKFAVAKSDLTRAPTPEKVQVGKSPQPHTIVERLEQTATEKANGEQPVKVRNDRTGEESVVMEGDTTPIKMSETPKVKPTANLDKKLADAGLDPSVFPNAASKREALRRSREKGTQGALTPAPLLPGTPSPSAPISVKSQRQMITDLSKALGVPIRFGRLTTSKFGGYFKRIANLNPLAHSGFIRQSCDRLVNRRLFGSGHNRVGVFDHRLQWVNNLARRAFESLQ